MTPDRPTFHAREAPVVAASLGVPTPWTPNARVSGYFSYFADADRLVVVAAPEKRPEEVDKALAYGLSYAGDRDLWLALPAGTAAATLDRVAFLDVPVRVFEHGAGVPVPRIVPSKHTVLVRAREARLATEVHDLGATGACVAPLVAWADAHPDLETAHRSSYLAWHCRGRQVLRISRSGVVAGVAEKLPRRHSAPVRLALVRPLTADEMGLARRAVDASIDIRLRGADRAPDEHWLQAVLRDPKLLGFDRIVRELPAQRAGHGGWGRAYIDLVGVASSRRGDRVHLVETKLGGDELLVLQGLDYWIWAEANRALLTAHLGVAEDSPIQLDFVVDGLGVHAAAQAEALAGELPWRFRLVSDWFEGVPRFDDLPRRSALRADGTGPARHTGPRFARRLHLTLAGPRPRDAFFAHPAAAVLPEARPALRELEVRDLVHRFAAHVRSSQAFALNLFATLPPEGGVAILSDVFGPVAVVDPPVFEFFDPADRLCERSAASPHTTQVDVLLRGTTPGGARVALLVEVKLSELDFGACSAFGRTSATEAEPCAGSGAFGGESRRCAQLANRGGPRRTYDPWIAPISALPDHAGCAFRLGLNQPMRNLALARMLVGEGTFDRAAYALCAHDGNEPIWRRWREVRRVFGGEHGGVELVDLPASRVLRELADPIRTAVAERYRMAIGS